MLSRNFPNKGWLLLFSCSVVSSSLWPPWTAALQASSSFTLSWSLLRLIFMNRWCHPTISSSVAPFFCPQSFPASGSFPVSRLFASGGQSIGASASASLLPVNIQSWFLVELSGFISLLSSGLSRVFSSTTIWKHQFFGTQPSSWSNSHIYAWLLEKPQLELYGPLLAK